jgi:hypothetical protein
LRGDAVVVEISPVSLAGFKTETEASDWRYSQVPPAHPTVKQVVAVQTKPRRNNDVFLLLFIFTQW